MPNPAAYTRVPRRWNKSIVFDGSATGGIGSFNIFTVTGLIWLQVISARCITTLTGASATLALGCAGNTGGLIAATTGTSITAGLIWASTSPATGVAAALVNRVCNLNIVGTVAVAAVTGGQINFEAYWLPLSSDGKLS